MQKGNIVQRDTDYLINNAKTLGMTHEQYRNSRERIEIITSMIQDALPG